MLVLILTVCSLASPDRCDEARLPFTDVTLMTCMTQGQIAAAEYIDQHPGLRLTRWRCALPEREGAGI